MPINYGQLAQQNGGMATVDYGALAQQHGGTPVDTSAQSSATSDTRNGFQRGFDTLTTVTPQQEKGHSGLFNKAQEFGAGTIQGVGEPFVHPIQTVEGIGHAIAHPINSAENMGKDALTHPAQAAGNLVGGSLLGGAAGEAAKGGVSLLAKIPTRAKAGAMFESLNRDLAHQPVTLTNASQPLQRVTEIGERGSTLPTAVNKLLQRSQAIEPMTFPEARDYQGSLSDLSQSDKLAMNGRVRGGVSQLNKGLFNDIKASADSMGRGEDYAKAMRDYRNASMIRHGLIGAAKYGVPAAVGAGVVGKTVNKLLPGH